MAYGYAGSVARLVHHLEKIDAPRPQLLDCPNL